MQALKGGNAGGDFAVITDPGTPLASLAHDRKYRRTFLNFPGVGGRYSALSYFGLVPAALMGVDVAEVLALAARMAHACASCVPSAENPGVALGAAIAELAAHGRDKVTFLLPGSLAAFGLWLEQLLAESTGKRGSGILPVDGEPVGSPSVYGDDRLFVHIQLKGEEDSRLEKAVAALRDKGMPVVEIRMDGLMDLGQEFLRWEIATATVGSVIGINPFDQPNVQEAKDSTNAFLALGRKQGKLPRREANLTEGTLGFYGDHTGRNAQDTLKGFLSQAGKGDYLALLAYLPEEEGTENLLRSLRVLVRDRLRVATTLGYGPRYLHSTGSITRADRTGDFS